VTNCAPGVRPLLLAALLALGAACSDGGGETQVRFRVSRASQLQIDALEVQIGPGAGPAFAPASVQLGLYGGDWSGAITGVPAGPQRQFDFHGLDASGTELLTASIRADVPVGAPLSLAVVLQPSAVQTPLLVSPPAIQSLTASSPTARPGQVLALGASVTTSAGDQAVLAWSADCGSIDLPAAANILWTAPTVTPSDCTLSLTATGNGGSVSVALEIPVR
jgi:hypothetical protein